MSRCHHIFVKGERKGEQCSINARSGAHYCSRHSSSAHATSISSKLVETATGQSTSKLGDTAMPDDDPSSPDAHAPSEGERPPRAGGAPRADCATKTQTIDPIDAAGGARIGLVDAHAGGEMRKDGDIDRRAPTPTMASPAEHHRHSTCTPNSHMRKYAASNPSHVHLTSASVKSTERCDISRFMGILETLFQKSATVC